MGLVNSILFQPPKPTYTADAKDLIWLENSLGERLPALFLPHPRAHWTILFSHANSEDIGFVYEWAEELVYHLGVNVVIYDYTGYGLSSGTPSEEGCYADVEAVWQLLTETLGIPGHTIVAYGRSLGSGPSVEIAYRKGACGVIVQSGFASAYRVATGQMRRSLPGDMFCNVDKVGQIACPIFVIHGTKDPLVPQSHGKAMCAAAQRAYDPLWIEDGSHNNLEIYWKGSIMRGIANFLQSLKRNSPSVKASAGSPMSSGCFKASGELQEKAGGGSTVVPCAEGDNEGCSDDHDEPTTQPQQANGDGSEQEKVEASLVLHACVEAERQREEEEDSDDLTRSNKHSKLQGTLGTEDGLQAQESLTEATEGDLACLHSSLETEDAQAGVAADTIESPKS